jgi:hypothetical protein
VHARVVFVVLLTRVHPAAEVGAAAAGRGPQSARAPAPGPLSPPLLLAVPLGPAAGPPAALHAAPGDAPPRAARETRASCRSCRVCAAASWLASGCSFPSRTSLAVGGGVVASHRARGRETHARACARASLPAPAPVVCCLYASLLGQRCILMPSSRPCATASKPGSCEHLNQYRSRIYRANGAFDERLQLHSP